MVAIIEIEIRRGFRYGKIFSVVEEAEARSVARFCGLGPRDQTFF
jgi:hypothetical protein